MTRPKSFDFAPVVPKKPADCKRHHWSQRMNLRTGELLDDAACWHCGTPAPPSKKVGEQRRTRKGERR